MNAQEKAEARMRHTRVAYADVPPDPDPYGLAHLTDRALAGMGQAAVRWAKESRRRRADGALSVSTRREALEDHRAAIGELRRVHAEQDRRARLTD